MNASRIVFFFSFGLLAASVLADTCQMSTLSDLQQIPGWQKLIDTVTNDLGPYSDIYVNWDKYPDVTLTECTAGYLAQFEDAQEQQCFTNSVLTVLENDSGSNLTSGSEVVRIMTGYAGSTTIIQSSTTTVGVGLEVSGEAYLFVASIDVKISTTFEFSTSRGSQSTQTYSEQTEVDYTADNIPFGSKCWIAVDDIACSYAAPGSFPIILDGWVWFSFSNPVNGHYDWAYNLDSFESDAERSYQVDLQAQVSANSQQTNGSIICEKSARIPFVHHHRGKVPKKHHNNATSIIDLTHHKPQRPLHPLKPINIKSISPPPRPKLTAREVERRIMKDIAKLPPKYRKHHKVINGHHYLAF